MNTPLHLALGAALTLPALAGDPAPYEKSRHHIFDPTPRAHLRELSTDRPDVTESAYTVDAGHLQFETTLGGYSRDHHAPERNGVRTEGWSLFEINAKVGLTNWADFQVVAPLYQRVRTSGGGAPREVSEGFGDLTLRLKTNLWGNDGGKTALALMPFVKIPTASDGLGNDAVEGGLIVPLAIELSEKWALGLMAEIDVLKDGDDRGYHAEVLTSATLGYAFRDNFIGYVEFVSVLSAEHDADWVAQVDSGFAWQLTPDVQFDAGVNIGLTRAAEDLAPFVGLTLRF